MLDFNSNAIFELPDIDLHNRILISSRNSDLKKSASSTARPKLWRLGDRRGLKLQTSAWAQNVQEDILHPTISVLGHLKQLFESGPTLRKTPKKVGLVTQKYILRSRGFHLKHFFSAIARRDLFTVFWVPEVRSKSRGRLLKAQASPRPLKFWPRSTGGRKLKVGILSSN